MELRDSVADLAFDPALFDRLRADLVAGTLSPDAARLQRAPIALREDGSQLAGRPDPHAARAFSQLGESAIRAGRVASLILNGGMATRFGGGAKGVERLLAGRNATFLSVKLGACARLARTLRGSLPVVVMNSFATRETSSRHLETIDWAGVPNADRFSFEQSIMPRVCSDGLPLADLERADGLADTDLYAAPGHGDTIGRLRASGVLDRLRDRGVEHILISNVDNLGATVDPVILGAHLAAADEGIDVTVEVVTRREGDAGGCVGTVDGRPIIVEAFRLPMGTELRAYPHFNTNTLWTRLEALDGEFPLAWFAVEKQLSLADGRRIDVIQFERLIGQITEFLASRFLDVDRDRRFLPIKTRADLETLAPTLQRLVDA